MVIIASSANNSLHNQLQTFNSDSNDNHLRDASFSSYLNNSEKTFVEKVTEPSRNFNPINRNIQGPVHQGELNEEVGEIGVFDAEKYFNGGEMGSPRVSDLAAKKYLYQKEEQTDLVSRKYNIRSGTPSVRSESSWNSQSALLKSSMRNNSSRNRKNKVQGKSFLATLGCKCSDKDSVDVSDHHAGDIRLNKAANFEGVVVHGKANTPKKIFNAGGLDANNNSVKLNNPQAELLIKKGVYFQNQKPENLVKIPSWDLNSSLGNQLVTKMQLQEETRRKPLEVFGSPVMDNRSKSLSFDKRLTLPSWDVVPPPKMESLIDFSANSGGNYINDVASDASSDLFEIESLTGKSNSNPIYARQTSDVVASSGCMSPTNGYAPSEASIEWSVVTASAVDYSAMSDCEEQRSVSTIRSPIRTSPAITSSNDKTTKSSSREMQKPRRPSMLLGCKSQKAVRVAGDAAFITIHEKPSSNTQTRRRSDNFPQVTRFQEESRHANFGAKHGLQHGYATPPQQRSRSPHASQMLYI